MRHPFGQHWHMLLSCGHARWGNFMHFMRAEPPRRTECRHPECIG